MIRATDVLAQRAEYVFVASATTYAQCVLARDGGRSPCLDVGGGPLTACEAAVSRFPLAEGAEALIGIASFEPGAP